MTLPNSFDMVIEQGKTFRYWFAVQYPDGEIADLVAEGYPIARLAIVPEYGETAVVSLTTAGGGIHLERMYDASIGDPDRKQWSGYLYIPATTTAGYTAWGRGPYEMEIDNGAGDIICVLRGTAVLELQTTP